MEVKWKVEGYHKESYHLLIERTFSTEKEAKAFGLKLRKTDKIVPVLLYEDEPIEEIK